MTQVQSIGALTSLTALSSLGAYGGYYYYQNWFNKESVEPSDVERFSVNDVSVDLYRGKLIDLFKTENLPKLVKANVSKNKDWWEWAYEKKYSPKSKNNNDLHILFQNLTLGWAEENSVENSLANACNQAYKQEKGFYTFTSRNLLLENIGEFCSFSETPIDLKEPKFSSYSETEAQNAKYNGGVLTKEANRSKLTKNTADNDIWWNWIYEYWVRNNKESTTFASVDKGYSSDANYANSVNNVCESLYQKPYAELKANSDKLLKEIGKFCSYLKDESAITPPEALNKPSSNPEVLTNQVVSQEPYSTKLISLIKTDNLQYFLKNSEANRDWWNWSFQERYEKLKGSSLNSHFGGITAGYSTVNSINSLNKKCDEAYKKDKTEYKVGGSEHLLKNILDFCGKESLQLDHLEPNSTTYNAVETKAEYKDGLLTVADNVAQLVKVDEESNQYWWNWAFDKRAKDIRTTSKDPFTSVTKGYAANGSEALNQACKTVYKKNKDDLKVDNLIEEVKKYCTKVPATATLKLPNEPAVATEPSTGPTTFNNSETTLTGYENTTILGSIKKTHRDKFIDPSKAENKDWWRWMHQNTWKVASSGNDLHATFQKLVSGYDDEANNKSLKQACEAAYKSVKSDNYKFGDTDHLLRNIAKFCTKKDTKEAEVLEPEAKTYGSNDNPTTGYEYGVLSVQNNRTHLVKNISENKLWWDWAYKYLLTTNAKSGADSSFTSLDIGYSDNDSKKGLNKACDAAYKKPYVTLNDQSQKLLNSIKKFCTPTTADKNVTLPSNEGAVTNFLKDANPSDGYTSHFSKNSSNIERLVDPTKEETWWKWNYGNYFPWDKEEEKKKLREPFSKVTSPFKEGAPDNTSLNGACKIAYNKGEPELKENNEKEKLLDSIKKFCVPFNKRSPDLQNPDTSPSR